MRQHAKRLNGTLTTHIRSKKLRRYYIINGGAFQPESEENFKISDLIPIGRINAIPMRKLSEQCDVDPRILRLLIQREREQGAPICSDWERGGYFMPANESEALAYYRQQKHRIKTARAALNGVAKYLRGGGSNEQ